MKVSNQANKGGLILIISIAKALRGAITIKLTANLKAGAIIP